MFRQEFASLYVLVIDDKFGLRDRAPQLNVGGDEVVTQSLPMITVDVGVKHFYKASARSSSDCAFSFYFPLPPDIMEYCV